MSGPTWDCGEGSIADGRPGRQWALDLPDRVLLALAPVRRRPVDQIAIVDGTLIPTRDHRLAAKSKNYRYWTNPQIAIGAPPAWPSPSVTLSRATATTQSSTAPAESTRSWPGGPLWRTAPTAETLR
ncbi:Transposase IS4 family [Micromonospora lupini str. Lupac 08]|uniref:Transposase IS4 family n=1 Tax=Micromonospora lupini str. Lupac 08 TaxID=1150864 RepID=I0L469_9ACTN|nr:Transposase IS4 family [Micromonospora lupini str. Lupac 08]